MFSGSLKAQEIVEIDFVSNISRILGQFFLASIGVNVALDTGADIYRVTYTTTGSDMRLDTASGLVMLPEIVDREIPILVYQHGTTDGRSDVPSNLLGAYQLGAIFAGKGMVVLAPDFLGLGTSRGFHPFVHAETEATVALDLLRAVRPFLEEQEIGWNEQLFVAGYSQGGHAAMAFHQYIEEQVSDEYSIDAALPMSGPYSISGVMRDIAFMDKPFSFPAYLVYTIRGIKEIYPELYDHESQIFKQEYLTPINNFLASGDGLFDMNEDLVSILTAQHGQSIPKHMFTDSILNVLENNPDHLFNQALEESDVFDWKPQAPVLMLYCKDDEQVPFQNSTLADSIMNLNGASDVSSMDVSNGNSLDHTACIVPALNVGIPWLLGFIDTSVSTDELTSDEEFEVYPNPTFGRVFIESKEVVNSVEVFNSNGQRMLVEFPNSKSTEIELSSLSNGLYVTHIRTSKGIHVRKLVLHR